MRSNSQKMGNWWNYAEAIFLCFVRVRFQEILPRGSIGRKVIGRSFSGKVAVNGVKHRTEGKR